MNVDAIIAARRAELFPADFRLSDLTVKLCADERAFPADDEDDNPARMLFLLAREVQQLRVVVALADELAVAVARYGRCTDHGCNDPICLAFAKWREVRA